MSAPNRSFAMPKFASTLEFRMLGLAVVLAVILSVVGAFYYLRVVKLMYFDEPLDKAPVAGGFAARVLMSANGLAVLVFGIFPAQLMALCYVAIATL